MIWDEAVVVVRNFVVVDEAKMAVVGDKLVEVHDMLALVLLEDKLLHGEKAMEAKFGIK